MKTPLILLCLHVGAFGLIAQHSGTVIQWGPSSTNVVKVAGRVLTDATAIAVGEAHCLALQSDGTVTGWGWNNFGQATGANSGPDNGQVKIAGRTLSNVSAIAASRTQSIALRRDGTVVIWGANNAGQRFEVPSDLTNAVSIAAGWDHCLVLKKDGTVDFLLAGKCLSLGVSNVTAIAAAQGYGFGGLGDDLALKNDGSVIGWNRGVPKDFSSLSQELTNITAIASSGAVNIALAKDGRVFEWSATSYSQSADKSATASVAKDYISVDGRVFTNVAAIATGGGCRLALKADSTVVAWGYMGFQPATVPAGLSNVVAIAAGNSFCLAITTNRAVAEKFMQK